MTPEDDHQKPSLVLPVIGGYELLEHVIDACAGYACVHEYSSAEELISYQDAHPSTRIPLILVNADTVAPSRTLLMVYADPRFDQAKTVILTAESERRDLGPVIDQCRLSAVARIPARRPGMMALVTSQLHAWMDEQGLDPIPQTTDMRSPTPVSTNFLTELGASEDQLTDQLVDSIDKALLHRPRIILPPGIRLTRQGDPIDHVFIVIRGVVSLQHFDGTETVLLHNDSTGRMIGILSLAGAETSFSTATTSTEVSMIMVSLDQLRNAVRLNPDVAAGMAVTAISALSQRLMRAEQLQVQRNALNKRLGREHKRLQRTLKKLKEARGELISQAKFATLGELSAGIAHELNNPVSALVAASEHLLDDVETILATHPQGELLMEIADNARHHEPLSTADERTIRRHIERITGDPEMAFRLVSAGVTDPPLALGLKETDMNLVEAAANIGTATRNVATASGRIAELVRSLRSYARPENDATDLIDVRETLDETLAMLSHRLRGIEVIKDYHEVPPVPARPSQLGQVWTNLLVNAADVLDPGTGVITITTSLTSDDAVRVEIIDNGPGISEDIRERIFEPRFTTKQGTVRYGMGLGLALTRTLIDSHGGTISVNSQPGRTAFAVELPRLSTPPGTQEDQ